MLFERLGNNNLFTVFWSKEVETHILPFRFKVVHAIMNEHFISKICTFFINFN
jgi:hypothetical protein